MSCTERYALIRFGLGNTHVCVIQQYETPGAVFLSVRFAVALALCASEVGGDHFSGKNA
mgnify:CR=1 FL=1